jgi:hypothetical protein
VLDNVQTHEFAQLMDEVAVEVSVVSRKHRRNTPVDPAPISVQLLRQSVRSNCFHGFKCLKSSDNPKRASKVKARKVPKATPRQATSALMESQEDSAIPKDQIPTETPVGVIQDIGVRWCGIPAEELTPSMLLAPLQANASTSLADDI